MTFYNGGVVSSRQDDATSRLLRVSTKQRGLSVAKAKTTSKTTRKATRTENAKKTASKSTAKKAAKPKLSKPAAAKKQKPSDTADKVAIDRRAKAGDRRKNTDTNRRKKAEPVAVERRSIERRAKVCRRRQIDPTTCERDYTDEELEFMNAMDKYKRSSGRMFPTCSEVLEVIRDLGYEKRCEEANVAGEQTAEQTAELSAERSAGQLVGLAAEPRTYWHAGQVLGQPEERIDAEKIGLGTLDRAAGPLIDRTNGERLIDPVHVPLPLDMEERDYSERVVF